jgi:hypothetical protein
MSTPIDPAAEQAAVQAGLAEQAGSVGGTDSAGIYGDPAGAGQHAAGQTAEEAARNLLAAGAVPHEVDVMEMLERIRALEADRDALIAAAAPAPVVPLKLAEIVLGQAPSVVHAFELAEERLHALEHPDADAG